MAKNPLDYPALPPMRTTSKPILLREQKPQEEGMIINMFRNNFNKKIVEYQNELISKHFDEVENIYRQMRGWRHDYHNHLQAIKAHIALGQIEELNDYCDMLEQDLKTIDKVIRTGNVMLDAILGSKISLAVSKDIDVNSKATVPKELNITDVDLCVLIGNLLDNAIEACERKTDENISATNGVNISAASGANISATSGVNINYEFTKPFIRIYIGMKSSHLYISVTNTFFGKVKKKGNNYISVKNKPNHGFGLMRIDKICSKYGGYCNRNNEPGAFSTEVLLPVGK